jgi:squalene-hopene/tetraprenyl-beta-curcumene cyclase
MRERQNGQNRDKAHQLNYRRSRPYRTILNRMRHTSSLKSASGWDGHMSIANDSKSLLAAIRHAQTALFKLQLPEGFWLGELEADSSLYSDYVVFMHWSGEIDSDLQKKCVKHLLATRLSDGGWGIYPGGPAKIDSSVKAYFALKLAGMERTDPRMRQSAALIRRLGGIEKTRFYTRFYLALLGQIPWKDIPAIPVELVLAPRWFPRNLYSVSAWTRALLVPMAIVHHFEPARQIPIERGISELFIRPDQKVGSPNNKWFSVSITLLERLQRCRLLPSRTAALIAAERWILDRMGEGSSGLGAILSRKICPFARAQPFALVSARLYQQATTIIVSNL